MPRKKSTKEKVRVTKSELEILEVMWEYGKPVTASELVSIATDKTWKASSVHLLMNSLIEKGYIKIAGFQKTTKNYARTFSPTLSKKDFVLNDTLNAYNDNIEEIFDDLLELASRNDLLKIKENIENKLNK